LKNAVKQELMMDQARPPSSKVRGFEMPTKRYIAGVLLVHGLNGARQDMAELANLLTERGILVENMLLPGHGTHVNDMLAVGWPEWEVAVRKTLQALKRRCDMVFLVGHSLGGALCLHTAAHEIVAGVVAMCAPLNMQRWLLPTVRAVRHITPMVPTIREDIRDPAARKRHARGVYGWTPMAPVESMLNHLPQLRQELPHITAPALIMTAVHDHVVPARDSREIYRLLGSQEKHLLILRRSYHVIMKDSDREEVQARTLAFIERHVARAKPRPGTYMRDAIARQMEIHEFGGGLTS
jgi:carboxylesterase